MEPKKLRILLKVLLLVIKFHYVDYNWLDDYWAYQSQPQFKLGLYWARSVIDQALLTLSSSALHFRKSGILAVEILKNEQASSSRHFMICLGKPIERKMYSIYRAMGIYSCEQKIQCALEQLRLHKIATSYNPSFIHSLYSQLALNLLVECRQIQAKKAALKGIVVGWDLYQSDR